MRGILGDGKWEEDTFLGLGGITWEALKGKIFFTFLNVQKSEAKRHAREGDCDFPRLTNLKTCVCVLINFTYESVKYFNFLRSGAVGIFDGFVYDYFLDESVKHLSG